MERLSKLTVTFQNSGGETELVCVCDRVIGERAKRARRYLVMFMETRDIYIYMYVCF